MTRLEQLQQFIQETPTDPFLHYALTMEYVKLGQEEQALLHFKNMVSDYPDYVGTYYHYGKLLEKMLQTKEAEQIYEAGITVARSKRNMHALGELQGALNLLKGMDEEDEDY